MLGGLGWKAAAVVGLGLALSSTAVGLQLLAERKALNSDHGRLAFAILLFQDLAAIPLLAVIPLLGHAAADGTGSAGVDGDRAGDRRDRGGGDRRPLPAAAAVPHGRAHGVPEMFTATALLAVLGTAWLMQLAGLSAGLGAFLAGVLLADSEFRHEIESHVEPFKGLLLGLFFIAVGMSIDLGRVVAEPAPIAVGVVALLGVKFALLVAIGAAARRLDLRESLQLGAVLALGGEFAFVVFAEADQCRAARRGDARPPDRDRRPVDGADAVAGDRDGARDRRASAAETETRVRRDPRRRAAA